ncbi:uncharacterized protein F5Z01DRAFT_677315 [Emericellopsis atlantica]|uniref:Mid2 domain-containing protein n=1 Tax=Emericellopsis atlantica TaxID=2614577 RepID=A0A9P8CKY4_9HYPO|nr:uncharacterized protein F5Z01DRAFT_677315 [Emericellopsis atlantica]KAG9251069.1 hypothetical protein F5Z01DRAFT_677315 [Emericellopsis atlantica]
MAEFFVPGPPPYPRWTAGDIQDIRYRTTFTEYTIALWQQFDGSAKLGPVLFQTTNGPDRDFSWVVQSYDLDLASSDKFFLWLFEGDPSVQGNASMKNQQSSGFFFISPEPTTTSTILPSSSAISSSPIPSSSDEASTSSSDEASKETGEVSPNSGTTGGELSTGAKVGIGVGAGVAGLAILAAILLFFKYRAKNRKKLEELRVANEHFRSGVPSSSDMSKTAITSTNVALQSSYELPGDYNRPMAELG